MSNHTCECFYEAGRGDNKGVKEILTFDYENVTNTEAKTSCSDKEKELRDKQESWAGDFWDYNLNRADCDLK